MTERDRQSQFTRPEQLERLLDAKPPMENWRILSLATIGVAMFLAILAIVVFSHRVEGAELRPAVYYGERPHVIVADYNRGKVRIVTAVYRQVAK